MCDRRKTSVPGSPGTEGRGTLAVAKSAHVRSGADPPGQRFVVSRGTPHCLLHTSPGSRICSFVPASPGTVISLTPSPRPGDGQVQYLAGSTDDSCVLSAQTPGAYRSQAGSATPFTGPRPREQGREGGAAAGRCPGQQSKACEVKLESVLRSLVGPRPPARRPLSPT